MVVGNPSLSPPTCYFCGDQVWLMGDGEGYEPKKVRKNDGTVSVETVCDGCNPKK